MIVRNSILYTSAAVLTKLGSFLLLPVWTAYLTPEEYGVVGTLAAYISMFTPLLLLGIPNAIVRQYVDFAQDEEAWHSYLVSNLLMLLLWVVPLFVVYVIFGETLWNSLTSGGIPFYPYIPLVGYIVVLSMVLRCVQASLQARQKAHIEVLVTFSLFVVSTVVGLTCVVQYNTGPIGYFIGSAVAATIILVICVGAEIKSWVHSAISVQHIKKALKYGLPLVPLAVSAWVMNFSDRIIVESVEGLAEAGIYNMSSNGALVMLFIVVSTNKAWTPQYFALMKDGDVRGKMVVVSSVCVILYALTAVGLNVLGVPLLVAMVPESYGGVVLLLPPIVLGYIIFGLYHLSVKPLLYYNQTGKMALIMMFGAALNIGLNVYFVPKYGSIAAAWTTLASYLAMFALAVCATVGKHGVRYPFVKFILVITAAFASLIFVDGKMFADVGAMVSAGIYVCVCFILVGLLFWKTVFKDFIYERKTYI